MVVVLDELLLLPVPLAPDPEVGVPLEPLEPLPELPLPPPVVIDDVPLMMLVPLAPVTAVTVALAADVTDVATTTRVVFMDMPDMLLAGTGMPGGPVEKKVAAEAREVTTDGWVVTTEGWVVTTEGMPVTTPREFVSVRKDVKGLSCWVFVSLEMFGNVCASGKESGMR